MKYDFTKEDPIQDQVSCSFETSAVAFYKSEI